MIYDVIIIGAGAAGMFCGANLKLNKEKVLILDKSNKPGLKLLVSGSGQCNFTHGGDVRDFADKYGEHGKSIRGILYRFNNKMAVQYFEEKGVAVSEREDGKIFPKSLKAEDIRQCLLDEIKKSGGKVETGVDVTAFQKKDDEFSVIALKNGKSVQYACRKLVIASGGCSYKKTGSDGSMFSIIEKFGDINIVKPEAALTPVYTEDYRYGDISGISIKNAQIKIKGKSKKESKAYRDDLLFTHKNFSGPLILNFSRYLKTGDQFVLNYIPDGFKGGESIDTKGDKRSIGNILSDETGLPKGFLEKVVERAAKQTKKSFDFQTKGASMDGKSIKAIEGLLKGEIFTVSGKAGFDKAMVTAGGVALSEISTKTMESKKYQGLYFIGEVLDVDGNTGGYNIQFAFASGYAAAQHISQLP